MTGFSRNSLIVMVVCGVLSSLSCGDSGDNRDCPLGELMCDGACADIYADDNHCGGCNTPCTATETCVVGLCESTCSAGELDCDATCVDPQTDPDHCGDCETTCDAGEVCVAGNCELDCGGTVYSVNGHCQSCIEDQCCAELAACAPDSDCAEAFDCMRLCQENVDCIAACLEETPDGAAAVETLVSCREQWCPASSCDAGVCNTGFLYTTNGFPQAVSLNDCVTKKCCDSFVPCWSDLDCNACLENPETTGCDTNTLYQAASTCQDEECPRMICDTDWSNTRVARNACWGDFCCTEFVACDADTDCNACIGGAGTECATNLLYNDVNDCFDANCPDDNTCGIPITRTTWFGEDIIECNRCAGDNCCNELTTCAGTSDATAIELCVACLSDPESAECADATVHDAAVAYQDCNDLNCADCI